MAARHDLALQASRDARQASEDDLPGSESSYTTSGLVAGSIGRRGALAKNDPRLERATDSFQSHRIAR